MKSAFLILFLFCSLTLSAQKDSLLAAPPELGISGFIDVFYVYDFNKPESSERQPFFYNHNRHNDLNLNLGLLKITLDHQKYRANFGLHTGTYANDNYVAEPGLLKSIFEANVGIALNKQNNFWLDAGILPSHIGFESAISIDNLTITRSLLAENSPYFLTGAKFTYHPNQKWEIAGLVLNGWQRIQRLRGNSLPSFGTQVNFSPNEDFTLNWSTFMGTDDPDTTRRMRYFNNFYGEFKLSEKLNMVAGFDIGAQQKFKGGSEYDFWFSPVIIGQVLINEKWKAAIRAEYYQDETGIIIPTGTDNGFRTTGISLNFDFSPTQNVICRLEGRCLNSKDAIFETEKNPINYNFFIATSIAVKFSEIIERGKG